VALTVKCCRGTAVGDCIWARLMLDGRSQKGNTEGANFKPMEAGYVCLRKNSFFGFQCKITMLGKKAARQMTHTIMSKRKYVEQGKVAVGDCAEVLVGYSVYHMISARDLLICVWKL